MTEREYLIDEICHIIEDTPKDELAVGKIVDYILKERQRIIQHITILNKDKLKDLNISGLVNEQESGTDKGLIPLDEEYIIAIILWLLINNIPSMSSEEKTRISMQCGKDFKNSKFGTKQQKELEICDTTNTERLPKIVCKGCETYIDNLGPCKTFCEGFDGRCAYCDHNLKCHPIDWHLIENQETYPARPTVSVEDIKFIAFNSYWNSNNPKLKINWEDITADEQLRWGYTSLEIYDKFFGDKQ